MNAPAKENKYSANASLAKRAADGDAEALDTLVKSNAGLVTSIAGRFLGRGAEFEDLCQIGNIGLIKAARTFDSGRGCAFSTYAVPLIMGEIRRFLRDDGIIKVGRDKKRLGATLLRMREEFVARERREPGVAQLATLAGVSAEEAAIALEAVSPCVSLSEPVFSGEDATIESALSDAGEGERFFEHLALSDIIGRLSPLRRRIVVLRYFKDLSQQKTAEILGLSQVKVSREEKKIIAILRDGLLP